MRIDDELWEVRSQWMVNLGTTARYEGDIVSSETYYYPHDFFKFSGSGYGNGVADFGFYADKRGG